MSIDKERLLSLIEFTAQSARLRSRAIADVRQHRSFLQPLYEHQVQGLPGVHLNVDGYDSDEEIWLVVERLHETTPPDVTSATLRPWIQVSSDPFEQPVLLEAVDGATLIEAGTHTSAAPAQSEPKPVVAPTAIIMLATYDQAEEVQTQFKDYLEARWQVWAEEERSRRNCVRLYGELFKMIQQLEGSIVEAQFELVWGAGLAIWNHQGTMVNYPLVGRLVEISLDSETAEIRVRPRDVDVSLELDWFRSTDNPGVASLEKDAKDFFGRVERTFSPFEPATFEQILKQAATSLDSGGIYWPDQVPAHDRTLPKPDGRLKVTNTWVLFARPRTNNAFLQDLEKLKGQVQESNALPPAVAAVVTDPGITNPVVDLPAFRGVSASYHGVSDASRKGASDLYFPKPFNDEQVRIVQLLEVSDGVVVQGPPGTGKTHTIANVICHYLAEGKRVLVTSLKEPALAVLQEHLPDEIRPLAIPLLTSEQEGMRQFRHSIEKIASEVQRLDRVGYARDIRHLEELIDQLHGRLASIDRETDTWAKRNLTKIVLDTEEVEPQTAAREVVEGKGQFEFIPDRLRIDPEFAPQFTDSHVVRLRDARRNLSQDIDYLDASLPQLVELPDAETLLEVHRDISLLEKLRRTEVEGEVPLLADSTESGLARLRQLLSLVENLEHLRDEVALEQEPWADAMRKRLRHSSDGEILRKLDNLGSELERALEQRQAMLDLPVYTPAGIELDSELFGAVAKLAQGKSAFGLRGLFAKSGEKQQLAEIRVLGRRPGEQKDWQLVAQHLESQRVLRSLASRWNALASDLPLKATPSDTPQDGLTAAKYYALCRKVKRLAELEHEVQDIASELFPQWILARELVDEPKRLAELAGALRHHITKARLTNMWVVKSRCQSALEGRSGRVIDEMQAFIQDTLGNVSVSDEQMQAKWSALTSELSRVLNLTPDLAAVREICSEIEASGAPKYAQLLRRPGIGTVDELLPDNWRKAWRLRRLTTFLESIDAQNDLKNLALARHRIEDDLSRAYQDVVVKRTWLKLAENASHKVRAALQAYLNAIQRIGRGTGVRAVRYRRDARAAASQANLAVPCWIMPHYRVSESLPSDLGCFDLVVIDEASQSDLTALPALLRAKKVLVVGDDKQVSPEGVGLEEEKIRSLKRDYLDSQVELFRDQMTPDRSIYDLFKVVFANSAVMLKEHFRCVAPIIEYSKREFYDHELRPLRVPKASQRLDPPLIDVLVEDGYRRDDINRPEARFIVEEIKAIVADPRLARRSIGVVSLLADKQAGLVWDWLTEELDVEVIQRHRITCGDARTFQGKERDIMFLSMVSAPNYVGQPLTRDTFRQRFNVAASRARDRMYLVRSVEPEHLSDADTLRRGLISHFAAPFAQDEARVEDLRKRCESDFERELYDELTQRGYRVTPQVPVGQYRIDLVAEGHNDTRLAIECDGDKYHGADKWADDMQRQRVLERVGWVFWRCFASAFTRRREEMLGDLLATLADLGIEPIGAEGAANSVHTEHRRVCMEIAQAHDGDQGTDTSDAVTMPQVHLRETHTSSDEVLPSPSNTLERPTQLLESTRVEKIESSDDRQLKPLTSNSHVTTSEAQPAGDYVAAVSAIPSNSWFQLAKWAKETGSLQPWERSLAFNIGIRIERGRAVSHKQARHGWRIWEEAAMSGFKPENSSAKQARHNILKRNSDVTSD